jgi:hypothetical protein
MAQRHVLHGAVLLNNFAAADAVDVLRNRHGHLVEPSWVDEFKVEIDQGESIGIVDCIAVNAASWLGPPSVATVAETKKILRRRTALGGTDYAKTPGLVVVQTKRVSNPVRAMFSSGTTDHIRNSPEAWQLKVNAFSGCAA